MFKIIILAVGTVPLLWLSWSSLRDRATHGFYRFFAFEALLVLFVLNVDHWFRDPLAAHQIISWVLLMAALVLALHGFHLLRVAGQPQGSFEETSVLVKQGAYRYIRHPLYTSLLLLGWGIFLKGPSLSGAGLAVIITASLLATARVEEGENLQRFGQEYADYMKSTRMFIPYLF